MGYTIDQLKKIKVGDSKYFVKTRRGFVDWPFHRVVLYQGYERALDVVDQYKNCAPFCKLRKDYFRLTGFDLVDVEFVFEDEDKIQVVMDFDWVIVDGDYSGMYVNDFIKEVGKEVKKRKISLLKRSDYENKCG